MTNVIARPLLLALLIAAVHAGPAHAAVQVIVGPTPIPDGEAAAARDVTVMNEKLAFALAVESPVPYGVPRGAIIDVGPVVGGKPSTRPCRLRRLHPEQLVGVAEHFPEGGHRRARPAASRRQDDTRLGQGHDRDHVHAPLQCGPDRDADDDDQHRRHAAGWPAVGPDAVAQRRLFLRCPRPRRPAGRQVDGSAGRPRRCVRRRLEHHAPCPVHELRRLPLERPVPAAHAPTR